MEIDNTMEILLYLRDEMSPEARIAFEAKMAGDSSLRESFETVQEVTDFIDLWEAPPLTEDIAQRVMETLAKNKKQEKGKSRDWWDSFVDWLISLGNVFTLRRLTPGLSLMCLVVAGFFFLPLQEQSVEQPGVTIKGGVKMMQGQRLPMATLLMKNENPDPEKIVANLTRAGLEVVHTEIYDTSVVVRVRNSQKIDLRDKLGYMGHLVRHNPGYLDDKGLTVIVIRN